MARDKIDYTHGDAGSKPADGNEFASGERPDAQVFDWFWNRVTNVINSVWDEFDRLDSDDDGIVDEADTANLYKGNDIDSDGDGTVNDAENVTATYKGNDIDSDGDGTVNDSDNLNGKGDEYLVPSGGIVMWSGAIVDIPSGWTLCDGTDGTPDLTDRFVVGAGNQYSVDATGGQDEVQLTENEMPSHTHNYEEGNVGTYDGVSPDNTGNRGLNTESTTSAGGDAAHENRPPYYALAFIMKT